MFCEYYLAMVLLIIGSYFLGNINFSILISKSKKRDVRTVGSGNPGTMNMLRSFGFRLGALTLVLDAVKGAIPAVLGWWLLGENPAMSAGEMFVFGEDKIGLYIGGISAVIGHCFPVIYKFKGGKGVASTIGVAVVASPIVGLIGFALAVIFFFTVKIGSIASFIAIGIPLVYESVMAFIDGDIAIGLLSLGLYALVVAMHHANIKRIFKGEEKKVYMTGAKKSANHIEEYKPKNTQE